ncbi:MAG TPA: hypothetical protein VIV40_36035 [Kofleriaceae bacterium]
MTLALPIGSLLLQGCEDETGTPNGDAPDAPPARVGTTIVYTSNVVGDHSHTFAIEASSFTSPPTAGLAASTSSDDGHVHTVEVAMADLQDVAAGQTVKITTGAAGGHTHVLTFVKLA